MEGSLSVRVPASTSNLGAGFDCLGLAVELWLEVELVAGEAPPGYGGTVAGLEAETDIIYRTLDDAGVLEGRRLTVRSDIPVSRGLGSSAAARVAGLTLAQLAMGEEPDLGRVYALAAAGEGHPDNVGPAVYGGLVLVAGEPTSVPIHPDVAVALAIPEKSMETKAARDMLPDDVGREVAVAQAARSAALLMGLTQGDPELIAFGMQDQLAVPHRKATIAGFDAAVKAGLEAGAYGVTISGAGSTLLGLSPPKAANKVAEAMAQALAACENPARAVAPGVSEKGVVWEEEGKRQG